MKILELKHIFTLWNRIVIVFVRISLKAKRKEFTMKRFLPFLLTMTACVPADDMFSGIYFVKLEAEPAQVASIVTQIVDAAEPGRREACAIQLMDRKALVGLKL